MILLVSGGLDSIASWRLLGCPNAIYVPLQTKAQARELEVLDWAHAQQWSSRGIVVAPSVDMREHEWANGYVPYRNLILVALAAQYDPHVVFPMIAEWAPDKNRVFFQKLSDLLTTAGRGDLQGISQRCKVETPFASVTKGRLLLRYRSKFGTAEYAELLRNTWSCYGAGELHCGRCSGCIQRFVAEQTIQDPQTDYETPPQVAGFYSSFSVRDVWRAVRGNGLRCAPAMLQRALEVRRIG